MKRLLFTHGADIDGMGNAILAKLAFENIDIIYARNVSDLETKFLNEYNAGNLYNYDIVYITDLSLKKEIADKVDRMHFLFEKIAEDMPEKLRHKFIPYIQLHEFEGLLFSDVDAFKLTFDEKNIDFDKIRSAADSFENPELINNSPLTAPSKRLIAAIPGYNKVIDGNCVAMDIGLNKIRLKCPLFNEWVEKLENI